MATCSARLNSPIIQREIQANFLEIELQLEPHQLRCPRLNVSLERQEIENIRQYLVQNQNSFFGGDDEYD